MEAVGRRKKGEPTSEGKKEKKIYIFFRERGERKREWVVYVEFYRDQNAEILPPVFPYNLQTSPFLLAFFSFLLLFLCSSSLSLFFSLLFSQCPFSSHSLSLSKKTLSLFNYLSLSLYLFLFLISSLSILGNGTDNYIIQLLQYTHTPLSLSLSLYTKLTSLS